MIVGRVVGIWRYPVKSMGGGRLESVRLGPLGVPGDRGWALYDHDAGEVRGAKNFPALMRCAARYLEEPSETEIPPAEIRLPDGSTVRSDRPEAAERLSALLRAKVTIHPRRPAEDLEHYRRRLPVDPAKLEAALREMFGRTKDEPLPDLSIFPRELIEYTSPRGTYFDAFPLHLVTTAWLDELGRRNPSARFDPRRFRPNLLIEPADGATGFVEERWSRRRLRIGETTIDVTVPCVRCVMPTLEQEELPKDPSVLRTVVRESAQNVGVYAAVAAGGAVRVGDAVELL
jgi:uncharacterized protein YcbX